MSYKVPFATNSNWGAMQAGAGLSVTDGIVSVDPTPGGLLDVGYFFSTDTQINAASINTVTLNGTTLSRGITLNAGSQITVSKTGNYTLSLMTQFTKADPSGPSSVGFFWLRKNGIDVADSASDVITTTSGAGVIASWTYTLSMNAGDYLEMVWHCAESNAILIAAPAQVGPPAIPRSPSVRITLLQV